MQETMKHDRPGSGCRGKEGKKKPGGRREEGKGGREEKSQLLEVEFREKKSFGFTGDYSKLQPRVKMNMAHSLFD